METGALKSFAMWARTALIGEVSARIGVVLAPGSPERVEQSNAVAALEKAVSAAGGGDVGRAAVADRVAYTWFNRIVALRFMDANGYTGIGVVSPERDVRGGQPEVLAEAKRGNIDNTVVTSKRTAESVTGLLNGTRRSDDPQGEAYALLLAAYCRFWNRSMPFMFEHEGDYTELLIPANLLADDSVLARAVAVLTEEVCEDVEVIGWLYQFYISERKDEVFAGFKKNKKAGASEIPAATQLFTPHWIVRYLVENSLGRLWLLNRPSSSLAGQMDYYIVPVNEETDFLKVASPEELKIIDPACGSGHMLTYAFDLLYAIYEEEGYAPLDIPSLILTSNLYGTEIDPRAGALAAFALTMKARSRQRTFFNQRVEPNICVLEPISFTPDELDQLCNSGDQRADEATFWNQFQHADTFGSLIRPQEDLIEPLRQHLNSNPADEGDLLGNDLQERARQVITQAEFLSTRYHVVTANPPYMGSGNLGLDVSTYLVREYPEGRADLYAAFMLRCVSLGLLSSHIGLMTPFTWMFIGRYSDLRRRVLRDSSISTLVQLEYSGFDGATVPICAFCLVAAKAPQRKGTFIRLSDFKGPANQGPKTLEAIRDRKSAWRYEASSADLSAIPSMPISYWATPAIRQAFADQGSVADYMFSDGLTKTGDNIRYMRFWWEISESGAADPNRYRPCAKGGVARDYFGNTETLVDWSPSTREHYRTDHVARITPEHLWDSSGITWTKISSRGATFRLLRPVDIPETAGPALYLRDQTDEDTLYSILGMLSSKTIWAVLSLVNPTLNFQTGDVLRLPYSPQLMLTLAPHVRELVRLSAEDWASVETARQFSSHRFFARHYEGLGIEDRLERIREEFANRNLEFVSKQTTVDRIVADAFGEVPAVRLKGEVTLSSNARYRFPNLDEARLGEALDRQLVEEIVSYSAGCMFGRFSLDLPGLILANQGETLQDYLAKVPNPSFMPDTDNVIPIVDGDWFDDDIVGRFRQFLRVAFGEEGFEENLRFVTESLGVKDLRGYFLKSFYKDHVKRYKKRPIYWLFSSPKGSFNALIYMHRYTPSTVSTVLNEYLREFSAKLEASRQHHERLAVGDGTAREKAAAQKEVDRLRKVILELEEYEHDVLYPLATQQVQIDLDDGVKANYPKFGAALKKIPGLEGKR